MRILVAEDERVTRASLVRQLQKWGHDVTAAEDGQSAWDLFASSPFDIVLTDWEMPRLSGVELIERIRSTKDAGFVYILMLTSRSDKSDVVRGIEAGADDFVAKPFDQEELRVRLLAGERIVRLERTLSTQNDELRKAGERMSRDLQSASRVQRAMLPSRPIITPRVRTAFTYVPADELCGDALGLHLVDDRYLIAYIADVSGHGVPAALLAVTAMHELAPRPEGTSLLRDTSGTGPLGAIRPPASVALELNRRFASGEHDGRYLTLLLCALDTHTGRLHYTSAGHPSPLLLRGDQPVPVPDAGGVPLALMPDATYEDGSVQLRPGDRLYLFSDGVIEQFDSAGTEQFGDDRLTTLLASLQNESLATAVARIPATLADWAGRPTFADDVSVVAVEWLNPQSP